MAKLGETRITLSLPKALENRLQHYVIDRKGSLRKQSEAINDALESFLTAEGF